MVRLAAEAVPAGFIPGNFQKNPVNLPEFIDIYGNSLIPERAGPLRHHTRNLPQPLTANTGNCGSNPTEEGC